MEERSIADKARIVLTKDLCHAEVARLMDKLYQYNHKTFTHSVNVGYIVAEIMIAENIEKDTAKEVVTGAILHDIGKLKIPLEILDKHDLLTAEESKIMQMHPQYGIDILSEESPSLLKPNIRDIILFHHEKRSGNGYPKRIRKIPYYAELIQAVDIYDAITADRTYHTGVSAYRAFRIMEEEGCSEKFIKKINNCSVK